MNRQDLIDWLAKRLWANGTASKKASMALAIGIIDELIEAGYLKPEKG